MKKLTKKLFISVMTLVLTAMALGTSTFAWFSMNTTATATGMEVQAKSNAMYLLIGTSNTIASNKSGVTETAAAVLQDTFTEPEDLYRFPAYYGSPSAIKSTATGDPGWYSASNKNSNNATNNIGSVTLISSNDLNKYVLTYKVWLTLSADSVNYTGPITCSLLKVADSDAAIAAVVEFEDGQIISLNPTDADFAAASAGAVVANGSVENDIALASNAAIEVTIRVYIDGTSANVYSDYINTPNQKIIGKCSIQFDLE